MGQPSFSTKLHSTGAFVYGKYDEKLWDMDAKLDIYGAWDPNSPRSTTNFNPFETFEGNSPDASGYYPGEGRYKDPKRPDVNYTQMMKGKCHSYMHAHKEGVRREMCLMSLIVY